MAASGIDPVKKGKKPSLLDTKKANEVIGYINALLAASFSPQGCCTQTSSKSSVNYDFSGLIAMVQTGNTQIICSVRDPDSGDLSAVQLSIYASNATPYTG